MHTHSSACIHACIDALICMEKHWVACLRVDDTSKTMQEFHQNMLATNFRIHACLHIVIHKKKYVSTCEHVFDAHFRRIHAHFYHFTKCKVTFWIVFLRLGNSSQNLESMVEGIQIKSEANETLRFASVCVCLYLCVCLKWIMLCLSVSVSVVSIECS
jgi:hypothetical protein